MRKRFLTFFGGKLCYLDDLQIWSRELSASEVLTYAGAAPAALANGLVAYYPATGGAATQSRKTQ